MNRHQPAFIIAVFISAWLLFIFTHPATAAVSSKQHRQDTIIIKPGFTKNKMNEEWKNALAGRMSPDRLDSFASLQRALTKEEMDWKELIGSKLTTWNRYKDSLAIPFTGVEINDTTYILAGYLGRDDGFTAGYQTVCLDLTALYRAYGAAGLPDNKTRVDRIFAHEYTHLLHKLWAKTNRFILPTFRDSILWECFYEGMGMYRSLNPKWLPVNGKLPSITKTTLNDLIPVFVDRLTTIQTRDTLTPEEKERLNKNLSRGSVNQKWGAFPVAIWLALEANGDDKKLCAWIKKGPASVIQLAKKYLQPEYQGIFTAAFK